MSNSKLIFMILSERVYYIFMKRRATMNAREHIENGKDRNVYGSDIVLDLGL